MTSEQLLATRATLWRQKAEPLITLEDAQSWLMQAGLCLFLPRKAQIPAPAPSFVEACLGETNPTPPRTAIESAKNLLARLIEANSALPLNLLGSASDHPDFLVSTETLPFVYALRGDRDWKRAPGAAGTNRTSPLITHVWQLMERRGVLTANEIQDELGKELTEAAVLRALHELWASLRVIPLYQADGQETLWEPLQSRHHKVITSGAGMSQVTALSVLASVYLQSVVAAGGDDAESFLSPLASRAKVREVIRGLTATRQLSLIQMETQSLLYVEGSLPEFLEAEKPVLSESELAAKRAARKPHPTSPQSMRASLRQSVAGSLPRPAFKRPASAASGGFEKRPSGPQQSSRGDRFRPISGDRPDQRRREGGYRSAAGSARPFKPRTSSAEQRAPRSEPGTGLRPDGTPKKTRWRDLPGGRPDQKGKPKRFGPRKEEGVPEGEMLRPAPRREPGTFRPAASSRQPGPKPSNFKPSFDRSTRRDDRKPFSGDRRASGSERGSSARPPFRPSGSRSGGDGSRLPVRSGTPRFSGGKAGSRPFQRPRRDDGIGSEINSRPGASHGDRKFTPRSAKQGGFSASHPRNGESRPYSPRPGRPSGVGGAVRRSSSGRPAGAKPFNRTGPAPGSRFKPGGKPVGSSYKPGGKPAGTGFKPGDRSSSGPPRTGSRPTFGRGPKPGGGGKFGASTGRPRPASGPKPGGRPPAKFRKQPESGE